MVYTIIIFNEKYSQKNVKINENAKKLKSL